MESNIESNYSLSASVIFPMTNGMTGNAAVPMENHWINVADAHVESISPKPKYAKHIVFGNGSILLPAAVNMHAHLELSQVFPAPLDIPSRTMPDWAAAVMTFRRSHDYHAPTAITQALHRQEVIDSTAAVADIVPPQTDVLQTMPVNMPVRHFAFVEWIAWRKEHVAAKCPVLSNYYGISPHAPQTVCPALLEQAVRSGLPAAMHLAETEEELQLLHSHSGPLLEMMRRADPDYAPKESLLACPMDYLRLLAQAPKALIIHGNYLADSELRFLAAHRETMAVVYCPRSHCYFRHPAYPLKKMLDMGVNVVLGTDSMASVPNLDMKEEIRCAVNNHPLVPPETIYQMATLNGARMLCLEPIGTIQPDSPSAFAIFSY